MAIRNPTPIGETFGRLTVIEEAPRVKKYVRRVSAMCSCGTVRDYDLDKLFTGNTKSCGCFERDHPSRTRHGQNRGGAASGSYRTWKAMKQRCSDPNSIGWNEYGGRGIRVCERWINSFENFFQDMGERPVGMTLDRERVNEDYGPGNCKWATRKEQSNNRRNTIFLEFKGGKMAISQWADELGVGYSVLYGRYAKGWPPERILAA
jgi:hypothetical protein